MLIPPWVFFFFTKIGTQSLCVLVEMRIHLDFLAKIRMLITVGVLVEINANILGIIWLKYRPITLHILIKTDTHALGRFE